MNWSEFSAHSSLLTWHHSLYKDVPIWENRPQYSHLRNTNNSRNQTATTAMENDSGFGNWLPPPPPAFSTPPASSRSRFPDQLLAGTTGSGAYNLPHQPQQAHHHLTCLKLGKRQYYGGIDRDPSSAKKDKPSSSSSSMSGVIPRCQVEGCNKALLDSKDYHRRHKVCEMHAKAPKVVVQGAEQRFCQQCSRSAYLPPHFLIIISYCDQRRRVRRFHSTSEFDDAKRSCRRRLAGHNERRRKSSGGADSVTRSSAAAAALGQLLDYYIQLTGLN